MSSPTKTRLSININNETALQLQKMVEEDGVTVTEAVRRAVAVYKFFEKAREDGQTVQLVGADNKVSTVQFLA